MELKEFIKASLVQINEAIQESNDQLRDLKICGIVNPVGVQINSENSQVYGRQSNRQEHLDRKVVHKIDFDVAVHAQEDTTTGGNAKISIASIGFGGNAERTQSGKSESRLKFSIPVIYPQGVDI
jgi:hypothetical protein